jgi:integrase
MQTDNTGRRLSVNEVLDAYQTEHAEVKAVASDRQEYGARHLRRLLSGAVTDIGIPECRDYVKKRRAEGAAPSTIRRELNILTAAANHARRWKRLTIDQMPQVELPEIPAGDTVKWFTKEQIATMFRARKSGHFACFLRIAYFTAARRRSVEALSKAQVDRAAGVIHLRQPGERLTKKRRPTVPLYPEIKPAVDWLFENSGTPHLFGRKRDFYKPFADLMEDLKLEGHPHMLRHSRASHMLMDGEDLWKVAKLLGDTVATVEKVYGHVSTGFLATESRVEGSGVSAGLMDRNSGMFRAAAE